MSRSERQARRSTSAATGLLALWWMAVKRRRTAGIDREVA